MSYRVEVTDHFINEFLNTMFLKWDKETLRSVKYVKFAGLRDDLSTVCEGFLDVKDVFSDDGGIVFLSEGMPDVECNVNVFSVLNSAGLSYFIVRPSNMVRLSPNVLNKVALKVRFGVIQPLIPNMKNMEMVISYDLLYNLAQVLKYVDDFPNFKWLLDHGGLLIFTDNGNYYLSSTSRGPLPANVGANWMFNDNLGQKTLLKCALVHNLPEGRWFLYMQGEVPVDSYFNVYMSMAFKVFVTIRINANAMVFVNGESVSSGDSVSEVIGGSFVISAYGDFSKWVVTNLDTLVVTEYEGVNSIELPADADYEVVLM